MALVAIVAVALATPGELARVAMFGTITACIAYLTYIRYSQAVSHRKTSGVPIGVAQTASALLSSVTLALAVIGLSDLAFLIGYYGFLKVADVTIPEGHWITTALTRLVGPTPTSTLGSFVAWRLTPPLRCR